MITNFYLEGATFWTNIFDRPGYIFQGWFTDPDGGTEVTIVTGSQTVYAHWEVDPNPITPPMAACTPALPQPRG